MEERVSVPVSVKSESSTSIGIFVRLAITRITGKPVGRASGVRGKRPARWQPSVDLGCESRTLVFAGQDRQDTPADSGQKPLRGTARNRHYYFTIVS